jgi:hypothetical protein
VCPLAPTLERGGMLGGGRYHNSVKTGIFKNSVIYLAHPHKTHFG